MSLSRALDKIKFNLDNYIIHIFVWLILLLITITMSVFYLLANHTNVIEKLLIKVIAATDGYSCSFDGEYFQLVDNNETINILYRYDEQNLETYIDKNKISNAGLYVVKTEHDNKIKSEHDILFNIENQFNDFKIKHTLGYGGGYTLQNIQTVIGLHRLVYLSNLNIDRTDILKDIVEAEAVDTSSIIYYRGDSDTFGNNIEEEFLKKKKKELFSQGYRGDTLEQMLEKEKYKYEMTHKKDNTETEEESEPFVYNTYNMIVLTPESEQNIVLKSDYNNYVRNNSGVIIGCCSNESETVSKMRWTIYKIEVITTLEKTILL